MIFNFNIPLAHGFVIDDMGWRESKSLKPEGPPRLHSTHNANINDYFNLVAMAKACGTRVFCAFILGEFDKENVCAKPCYNMPEAPSNMTEFGLNWKNTVNDDQIQTMDFLKENSQSIDFALHGVRHGHYATGEWEESEWAKRCNKEERLAGEKITPWDEKNLTNKLTALCYKEILRQYFTEEELPFPESFVPPNHAYFYRENAHNTTGAVLSEFGVKYANFKNTGSGSEDHTTDKIINFDHKLTFIDRRGVKHCSYKKTGAKPFIPPRNFPWIEAHFNNIWGSETYWAKYLKRINLFPNKMLGKNTEHVFSQWIYKNFAKVKNGLNSVTIDCTQIPEKAYENEILSYVVLKIFVGNMEIESVSGNCDIFAYYKDKFGFAYLTVGRWENLMGRLDREIYKITYKVGRKKMPCYVDNSMSTFYPYGLEIGENEVKLKGKFYGRETVKIKVPFKVASVTCSKVKILGFKQEKDFLYIDLKALCMLGDTDTIVIGG